MSENVSAIKAFRDFWSYVRKYPDREWVEGHGNEYLDWEPPLPDEPTEAPCGSLAKIQIMRARVAAKQHLYHPDDCPLSELRRNGSTHFPRRGGQT